MSIEPVQSNFTKRTHAAGYNNKLTKSTNKPCLIRSIQPFVVVFLTLSASLEGVPDAGTGLVYLSGGRFYDPAVGRPLQPNPAVAPPSVPQALNRYAATSVGTGVVQGAQSNILYNLGATALQSTIGSGIGKGLELGLKHVGQALDVGYLRVNPWRLYQLKNVGYRHLFTYHRQGWYISEAVQPVGDDVLSVVGRQEQIALSRLRSIRGLKWELDWPLSAKAGKWLRGLGGEFLAANAVELALALPQVNDIWNDPYYSPGQKQIQTGVVLGSSVATAGLSTYAAWALGASAWGSFGIGLAVGGGVYLVTEWLVKPGISWVTVNIFETRDPFVVYRNLKPLEIEN